MVRLLAESDTRKGVLVRLAAAGVVALALFGVWLLMINFAGVGENPDAMNPLDNDVDVYSELELVTWLGGVGDEVRYRVTVTVGPKIEAIADPGTNIGVSEGVRSRPEGFDGGVLSTIFEEGPDGSLIREGPDGPLSGTLGVFAVDGCVGGCVRTFIVTFTWTAPVPEGSVYPVEEGVEVTAHPWVYFITAEQFRRSDGSGIVPEDLTIEFELIDE